MAFFEKIITKGDFHFSIVLSYFVTWFLALRQTVFSVYVLARLLFYFLVWVLVFAVIMAVMERITHRALFGNKILGYYPWKIAATISVILSLLLGVSYAFTGDTTLTPLRITTLLVGFAGCVAILMWYLHTMVKE